MQAEMVDFKDPAPGAEEEELVNDPANMHPTLRSKLLPCIFRNEKVIETTLEQRIVRLNQPEYNEASLHNYPLNDVTTTKYNLLTFLPKNLWEQFQKAANFYFLLVAILVLIPNVSTIEPYTSITPLVFVLSVTAVREAYEDYQRYKNDIETNGRQIDRILPNGKRETIEWSNVRVGDILECTDGHELPADMVLLASAEEDGSCNIMTANLDGETNLKSRISLQATQAMRSPSAISKVRARVRCEPPNPSLHKFEATWMDADGSVPLNSDNLLLRGAKIMETDWAYGLVVYTGIHSKLVLNSNNPRFKRSNVEMLMNKQMMFIFLMQFILVFVCTATGASFYDKELAKHWYLRESPSTSESVKIGIRNFAAYYILFSVMVPISLYVSMEIVKVAQSFLISTDGDMYDPISDTRAVARASNLNEELGQVKYVFSDKTGTLTQNKMSFYKCSVNGVAYGENQQTIKVEDEAQAHKQMMLSKSRRGRKSRVSLTMQDKPGSFSKFQDDRLEHDMMTRPDEEHARMLKEFFTCLSVCHTVTPSVPKDTHGSITKSTVRDERKEEVADDDIEYRGNSIDEVALVVACQDFGFTFKARDRTSVTIDTPFATDQQFDVLHTLDFTSDRKRMSVVVRMPDGKLRLYTKGADSVMLERISGKNSEDLVSTTKLHLEEFSAIGLRTLVLGYADLDEAEYNEWAKRYEEASNSIGNRAEDMDKVGNELEKDLMLIGVSAIEDALQVGVVDTLTKLKKAGMKVWMLTGDKQGTAVNIGKSCGLISPGAELMYMDEGSPEELRQLTERLDERLKTKVERKPSAPNTGMIDIGVLPEDQKAIEADEEDEGVALVVDGPPLERALKYENEYFGVINHPETRVVICSRMAPQQKASIVKIVKDNLPVVTLAVGDGANDVSMIQMAHVGIGIRGKEGLQAVNTSDYAISQFRFLSRLLLVHGRYSYKRNTKLILYSFYKSMVISFTQFYFSCFSAFSGAEVYDGLLLNTFNLFFASLPILALAVFDRDLHDEELLDNPVIYKAGIRNTGFNFKVYWSWIFNGVFHAIWVFFVPYMALSYLGLWAQSMAIYTCLVVVVNTKIAVLTNTWTFWNVFFTAGSIIFWFVFGLGASSESAIEFFPNLFGVFPELLSHSAFWLSIVFVGWIGMWQDYLFTWFRHEVLPVSLKLLIQLSRRRQSAPLAVEKPSDN